MASATRQRQPSTGAACPEARCRSPWPAAALYHWNGRKEAVVILALHHGEATVVDLDGDLVVYPIHRLQLVEPIAGPADAA